MEQNFDSRIINNIRILCADMVQKPNSGHPGMPMGMAPMAYILWNKIMRYSPKNPKWWNRDRFVLSNGHGCALLYSMLHLTGYPVMTLEDLKSFRTLNSKTPGHPEASSWNRKHDGIEVTTGPLGQGFSNAVGIAIGQAHLAAVYNKEDFPIFDSYTYVFCGDGCLQEGISSEASSLAGHLGLGRLIVIYDENKITIDGESKLAFSEDVTQRYESYGWQVLDVMKGDDDLEGMEKALLEAKKDTKRPTLIRLHTTIGFGSSKQGKEEVHGSPLGEEDVKKVKEKFGFDPNQSFYIDEKVKSHLDFTDKGEKIESQWNELFQKYSEKYPELSKELKRRFSGELPQEGWKDFLPTFTSSCEDQSLVDISSLILNKLANQYPEFVGGNADSSKCTKACLIGKSDFSKETPQGRNLRFGVRTHSMFAIVNGLCSFGGFIPFGSTMLNFIGYGLGAITLAAISDFRSLFIFSDDIPGSGEDGPAILAIDKYAVCRSMPNLLFMRPSDGNEVSGCYALVMENYRSPIAMSLTNQKLPHLEGSSIEGCSKGAYVIKKTGDNPEIILVGTGSEVKLCIEASNRLNIPNQVVSFPCWEIFEKQSEEYKLSVFPEGVPVLSIEAGVTFGWNKYAHASIGIDTFGLSGSYNQQLNHFGITVENLVEKSNKLRFYYKGKKVPSLINPLNQPIINKSK